MAEIKIEKNKITRTLKSLAFGIGGGLLSFILSGDGGSSVAFGLLLIYFEYRIDKFQNVPN